MPLTDTTLLTLRNATTNRGDILSSCFLFCCRTLIEMRARARFELAHISLRSVASHGLMMFHFLTRAVVSAEASHVHTCGTRRKKKSRQLHCRPAHHGWPSPDRLASPSCAEAPPLLLLMRLTSKAGLPAHRSGNNLLRL